MKNYGHGTPKPTLLLSNTKHIEALQTGKLDNSKPNALKTCRTYRDGTGKLRWQGTRELKQTQPLVVSRHLSVHMQSHACVDGSGSTLRHTHVRSCSCSRWLERTRLVTGDLCPGCLCGFYRWDMRGGYKAHVSLSYQRKPHEPASLRSTTRRRSSTCSEPCLQARGKRLNFKAQLRM